MAKFAPFWLIECLSGLCCIEQDSKYLEDEQLRETIDGPSGEEFRRGESSTFREFKNDA